MKSGRDSSSTPLFTLRTVALISMVSSCTIDGRMLSSVDASVLGCTVADTIVAPPGGLISTLADGGATNMFSFSSPAPMAAPTFSAGGGLLNITIDEATDSAPQFSGVGIYFQSCLDASAFAGVAFTISGTVAGCTLEYATNFAEDTSSLYDSETGSCPLSGCYSPKMQVVPTSTPTVVMVPWNPTFFDPGYPVPSPDDPAKLTGVQWEFIVPATSDAGSDTCVANVTVTDLKFYN